MLTERTTTLFVSIFYFQKCQTRDYNMDDKKRQPYDSKNLQVLCLNIILGRKMILKLRKILIKT